MSKQLKKVLITAGGTLEAIDGVRQIKNTSSGKLGTNVANVLSDEDTEIIYVSNRYAVRPTIPHRWIETTSVLDVEQKMKDILTTEKIDIVIHSMAVADYTVSGIESEGVFYSKDSLETSKLSSSSDEIKIVCKKAPKILPQIKEWQPHVYLVGFKLLNNVTEDKLFDVAFNQLRNTRCNLVIANDLNSIKKGSHEGLFVYPEKQMDKVIGKENIALFLKKTLEKRAFSKRTKSIQVSSDVKVPADVKQQMKKMGEQVFADGLLPVVTGGTYGNLSVKKDNRIYITGRNVHKGTLTEDTICILDNIEYVNGKTLYANIPYHGKIKPSIDSAIHDLIYNNHPVQSILHLHTNKIFNTNMTVDSYVCGSKEEADAILQEIEGENVFVQMKKHGVIIGDDNLDNCYKQWKDKLNEVHLTPYNEAPETIKKKILKEWFNHLEIDLVLDLVNANINTNVDDYYLIQKGNEYFGLVVLEEMNESVQFSLYTLKEYQNKKLGLGKKCIDILNKFKKNLVLKTKKDCNVVDYYKKQSFRMLHEDAEGFIYLYSKKYR